MPELPEVETIMRGMQPAFASSPVKMLKLYRPDLRFPIPKDLPGQLKNEKISLQRRGKYIVGFGQGDVGFVLHLGMSGRVKVLAPGRPYVHEKHDHFYFLFADTARVIYNDPRRFGFLDCVSRREWKNSRHFQKMGPEPLDPAFDHRALASRLSGRKTPIKQALLDQTIVAGLGNIYVSEALFHAEILPLRAAGSLSGLEIKKLVSGIQKVLRSALDAGGSTLKDYRHTDDSMGYFQHHFSVYDRCGQPCAQCNCDIIKTGGVKKITQAARSTFYCETRQK